MQAKTSDMYKKKIDDLSHASCVHQVCQGFATHFHRNLIGISSNE